MAFTKGISFPFRVVRNRIATSIASYDDTTKIKESIYQIVTITLGEWANEPTVGSNGMRLVFASGTEIDSIINELVSKIEEIETRVEKVKIEKLSQNGTLTLNISYKYLGTDINQYFKVVK